MKKCPSCKTEKDLSEFGSDKSKRDGKSSFCKLCSRKSTREWYKNNREKAYESTRRWVKRNPEKRKEIARKCNGKLYKEKGHLYREKARERHNLARAMFLRQLGARCCECGYDKRKDILEFDHIAPVLRSRKTEIGGFINWACSNGLRNPIVWDTLHTNIQILCPNCHAIKTRDGIEGSRRIAPPEVSESTLSGNINGQ